jgi:hypothetical protein
LGSADGAFLEKNPGVGFDGKWYLMFQFSSFSAVQEISEERFAWDVQLSAFVNENSIELFSYNVYWMIQLFD